MRAAAAQAAADKKPVSDGAIEVDLDRVTTRELNQRLHRLSRDSNERLWRVANPKGKHSLAVGLDLPITVHIMGHAGYYCAGMNKQAEIVVHGHVGTGVAENMMSGLVHVTGNASAAAGASGRGGLLLIEGDAASRCGISMKGIDIVVGGTVGHMSAFMAQAGNLVVCGDAGSDLGDSIYEAEIFVAGKVASLGSDCIEREMTAAHRTALAQLLDRAGLCHDAARFRRYGSARKLYNFHIDHAASY